jgi:hypothetical protein
VNGKFYTAKTLNQSFRSNQIMQISEMEREINFLKNNDYPLIPKIEGIIDNEAGFPFIMIKKCEFTLE